MNWKSENTELILQDAMEGMQDMPDNSFDLCIADPPYGALKQRGNMIVKRNSMGLEVIGN